MKDYIIKTSKNKKDKTFDITISGHLNVSNILLVKKELDNIIKKENTFSIVITDIEDADLSLIQLVLSLKNKFETTEKQLTLNINHGKEMYELYKKAGFENLLIKA
jgi:ABC-type transporter Mla MlaB component